jgi:hypothetical protein
MNSAQVMINQINGIINQLVEEDGTRLPKSFIDYFAKNATVSPREAIDFSKKIEDQELSEETLVMLVYLNNLLKK